MASYGIDTSKAYGVSISELRKLTEQIGKGNKTLHKKALVYVKEIEKIDSKSAKWIAKDAIRELTDLKTVSCIK